MVSVSVEGRDTLRFLWVDDIAKADPMVQALISLVVDETPEVATLEVLFSLTAIN